MRAILHHAMLFAFAILTSTGAWAQVKGERLMPHNYLMEGVEWTSPDGNWLVQRSNNGLQLLDRYTGKVEHEFGDGGYHEFSTLLGRFTPDGKAFVIVLQHWKPSCYVYLKRYDIAKKKLTTKELNICDSYEQAEILGISADCSRLAVQYTETSFGKPNRPGGEPTESFDMKKFQLHLVVVDLVQLEVTKELVFPKADPKVFVDEDVSFVIWSDKRVGTYSPPVFKGGYYASLLEGSSYKTVLDTKNKVNHFFGSTLYIKRINEHYYVWHHGSSASEWNEKEPIHLTIMNNQFKIVEQVPMVEEGDFSHVMRTVNRNGLWLLTGNTELRKKFETQSGEHQPELECKQVYALRHIGFDGAYLDTVNYLPKVIDAVRLILPNNYITYWKSGVKYDEIPFPVDIDFSLPKLYIYHLNLGWYTNRNRLKTWDNFLYADNDLMVVPRSIAEDTVIYYSTVNLKTMTKELDVPLVTQIKYFPPEPKPRITYKPKRVVCFGCGGTGVYPTSGTETCKVCNGSHYYGGECGACKGTGREQKFTKVEYVNGYTGQQYGSATYNTGGFCRACSGTGHVSGRCWNCSGQGVVGVPGPCPYCNATGHRTEYEEVIEK
ncbi:MAG: hypothetical protein H6601_02255 [Flavobacteriales bacterium]|nr:hypothetical protein [Flavobacteriales bacterium]